MAAYTFNRGMYDYTKVQTDFWLQSIHDWAEENNIAYTVAQDPQDTHYFTFTFSNEKDLQSYYDTCPDGRKLREFLSKVPMRVYKYD